MTLSEFNSYMIGINSRQKNEQKNLITTAYYTASFTNSDKKPKSLSYYLKMIDKDTGEKPDVKQSLKESKELVRLLKGR